MTTNGLSEDAAHRLIARAIELDARRGEEVSIAQLREVAQEAGISSQAFEEALLEVSAIAPQKPTMGERLRRWFRKDADVSPTRSIIDRVGMNVIAFGAFMALASLLMRTNYAIIGTNWVSQAGAMLVANLLGVAIARRLNARVTTLVLSVTAISQVAEFALHLVYGIKSVQSGPTHMAVILASLLGVAVGAVASHRRSATVAEDVEPAHPAEEANPGVTKRVVATLRLRPT